jgi:hypothetical protein
LPDPKKRRMAQREVAGAVIGLILMVIAFGGILVLHLWAARLP